VEGGGARPWQRKSVVLRHALCRVATHNRWGNQVTGKIIKFAMEVSRGHVFPGLVQDG
jgi:hypothetical protein